MRFTPEGERYGFQVKLPDQEKGASEPQEEALRRAEETARTDWKIDFSRYRLVESSKSVLPGGRTDHTFVTSGKTNAFAKAVIAFGLLSAATS